MFMGAGTFSRLWWAWWTWAVILVTRRLQCKVARVGFAYDSVDSFWFCIILFAVTEGWKKKFFIKKPMPDNGLRACGLELDRVTSITQKAEFSR